MELTQDLAVLQSSISLAEKNCNGLATLPKGANSKVQLILTEAVSEITQGLRRNLDAAAQDGLRYKITGVLVALSLQGMGGTSGPGDQEEFWFSVLQGLPAVSRGVLFDVIKTCGLQQQLFTILSHVDQSLGLRLLSDLVNYLDHDTDDLDTALLVDLLQYLFLVNNPYIYDPNSDHPTHMRERLQPAELDICNNLSKLAQKGSSTDDLTQFQIIKDGVLFSMLPDSLKSYSTDSKNATILMCVSNALSCLITGSAFLVSQPNYLHGPLTNFLKEKTLKNVFSPGEAQQLFLASQDEQITKDLVHSVKSQLKQKSDSVEILGNIFLKMTHQDGHVISLNKFIGEINEKNLALAELPKTTVRGNPKSPSGAVSCPRVVSGHQCRMILRHLTDSLGTMGGGSSGSETGSASSKVTKAMMTTCHDLLTGQALPLTEMLGDKLWDWCRVAVTAQLKGHKDLFEQCLGEEIPKKSVARWLELVEANLPLLGSAEVMKKWLQFAVRLVQREKKSISVTTVRMMTLAAYKKLPLSDQASVIVYAHHQGAVTSLWEGGSQLQMKMTTAFNRLVKNTGNLKTSLGAVSELLLLAPRDTLKKMVHQAVHHNGLAGLMAEILQSLPGVSRLSAEEGPALLVQFIGQAAAWELSRSEEQNLISFVKHLFQMSAHHLLDPHQLVSTVVLPDLVHHSEVGGPSPDQSALSPPNQTVPPLRALSLLRVTLETQGGDVPWLGPSAVQPAPLLLCLCGMLEACSPLYTCTEVKTGTETGTDNRASLKEQLIEVVTMVTESLLKTKDSLPEKDLMWLYNSALRLHWTTLLRLEPLFTAVNPDKYPMRVPAALTELVVLPPTWTSFPYKGPGDSVYLTLDAVRSGARLQRNDQQPLPQDIYIRAVAALAMLLPDSVTSEAEAMVSWLVSAGTADCLQPQQLLSHGYIPESLYRGVARELRASRLLGDVLRLVDAGGLSERGHRVNLHVANLHVTLMKSFCLSSLTADSGAPSPDSGALCVLRAECFVRLCHQMSLFPAGSGEPLFVLVLDVLQAYGSSKEEALREAGTSGGLQDVLTAQTEAMQHAVRGCTPQESSVLIKAMGKQGEGEAS